LKLLSIFCKVDLEVIVEKNFRKDFRQEKSVSKLSFKIFSETSFYDYRTILAFEFYYFSDALSNL